MANLVRRGHTFNELFDFRNSFDQLFNRFLANSGGGNQNANALLLAVPPIEVWVDTNKKEYHLSVALPGVDPKEIQVNLHGNELTVEGERQQSQDKKDANYQEQEFSYQRFQRTITLPEGVDAQKLSAEYDNGVLEVTAPLKESALPRQIEVKSMSPAKAIDTKTTDEKAKSVAATK
jgi:HSP20 family protein